jgi:hypothetical protein
MPCSEERGGMAARSEAEINSLLVYKSPARQGGVLYSSREVRTVALRDDLYRSSDVSGKRENVLPHFTVWTVY